MVASYITQKQFSGNFYRCQKILITKKMIMIIITITMVTIKIMTMVIIMINLVCGRASEKTGGNSKDLSN